MRAATIRQQSDPSPRNESDKVLENELDQLRRRVLETAKGEFFFDVTRSAKAFLLLKGSQQSYGAQHLKLSIERHLVYPLANLFATDQIQIGDKVRIDRDHNQPCLNFIREIKDLLTPLRHLEPEVIAGYAPTNIGESVDALAV